MNSSVARSWFCSACAVFAVVLPTERDAAIIVGDEP
jgi:hypothetical protein